METVLTCEIDAFRGLKYLLVWFGDFDQVVYKDVPTWLLPVPSYRGTRVLCVLGVVFNERG